MIYKSESLAETSEIAKRLLESVDLKEGSVVLFYGDLGAGKTAFIQLLAKELGITEPITSPTFVIQKTYKASKYFNTLVHIDAYRLSSGDEILKLNFKETISKPNSIICIEWPENIKSAIPENSKKVFCRFVNETTHEYEF